jgi:hypothetical protein
MFLLGRNPPENSGFFYFENQEPGCPETHTTAFLPNGETEKGQITKINIPVGNKTPGK